MKISNQSMAKAKVQGFTLIETLVAVAIISLLCAVAIPQYTRMVAKTRRTEAYVLLNGAHKAQIGYYATNSHFLLVCGGPGAGCPPTVDPALSNQKALGLDIYGASGGGGNPVSKFGYEYHWSFGAATGPGTPDPNGDQNYELLLDNVVSAPGLFPGAMQDDMLFIAVEPPGGATGGMFDLVTPGLAQQGVPYLLMDAITGATNI